MSNQTLALAAIEAVSDKKLDAGNPGYPDDPGVERKGMCSRFVRCASRKVYGQKYQDLFGGSAIESGHRFERAGLAFTPEEAGPLQAGDILFKMQGSGGFGHIGIYLGAEDGRVAENSSAHPAGPSGAKGYRTLAKYGSSQLIGRLPEPGNPILSRSIYLNKKEIGEGPIKNDITYCQVRVWADHLGFDLDWSEESPHIWIQGKSVGTDEEIWMVGGKSYLPIRTLVSAAGLVAVYDPTQDRVVVSKPG